MTAVRSRSATSGRWPRFSPAFLNLLQRALVGVAIFRFVAQLVAWFPIELARTDHYRDVGVYFDAAMRLKRGVDVYQPWPEYGVQMTPSRFFYSPIFLLLVRPLVILATCRFRFWGFAFGTGLDCWKRRGHFRGGLLGMACFARRQSRELRLALVAGAGALFAPLCWSSYLPLLLLPCSVRWGEKRTSCGD